jgi:fatty-acyl-CoA synthase
MGLRTDTVERRALEREGTAVPASGGAEGCRRLTRLGRPLPGLELRIVDPATEVALPERTVGEIEVAGTSVSPGYYGRPDATAAAFHDGFLRTGDLGYLAEADLVVCGRVKDVIVASGRNVFPEDVEWAVGTLEGVRGGNVVAFGVQGRHGREALVVIAETRTNDLDRLRNVVAQRARATVGLSPADIVLVPPGTLPKTTSGKLQRSLCRDRYLADQLTAARA